MCAPGEAMRAAARSSAVLDDSARRLPEIARIFIETAWKTEAAHEQLGARGDAVRCVDRFDVAVDRLRADPQLRGHLLLRGSRQEAAQDVAFPARQAWSFGRLPRGAVAERELFVEQLEQVLVLVREGAVAQLPRDPDGLHPAGAQRAQRVELIVEAERAQVRVEEFAVVPIPIAEDAPPPYGVRSARSLLGERPIGGIRPAAAAAHLLACLRSASGVPAPE